MLHALITSLSDALPTIIGLLVTWLTGWLTFYIRSHLKLKDAQLQQVLTDSLTDVINRGATLAASRAQAGLKTLDGPIRTGNTRVDGVANYVATMNPDLLKKVGIDVTSPEGEIALTKRILATAPQVPTEKPKGALD